MRWIYLIAIIGLLSSGCVSTQPAKIENGQYINPSYQFSLQVPAGWKANEKIPQDFKNSIPSLSTRNFKTVLYDLNNKRFILVAAEKTKLDWVNFKMYDDKFIDSLIKYYAREKNEFLKKTGSKYYQYKIHKPRIKKCDGYCKATTINFGVQDLKATGNNIIFKSNNGMLYSTSLILIAREKYFREGHIIYEKVMGSFQLL